MPGTFECHSLLELLRQEEKALQIIHRELRKSIHVSLTETNETYNIETKETYQGKLRQKYLLKYPRLPLLSHYSGNRRDAW